MLDARSDSRTFIMRRPFKEIVCAITLVAFLFNILGYEIAWAARTPLELTSVGPSGGGDPAVSRVLNVKTFTLPLSLGTIKDSWQSTSSTPRRGRPLSNGLARGEYESLPSVVIHIQDAHCNYAAQLKVSEIIEYLNNDYGISVINLEGGARDYDLSVFTAIAEKGVREKVADYFVKEGTVNGAEYFAANNPDKVSLWGIEDVKLYMENLKAYRDSLAHKDEVEEHLKALSYILTNLKTRIYSKALLEFDAKYSQYKANNLDLKDYIGYLAEKAKERGIDIKSLHNLFLMNQALGEEGNIDFNRAEVERDALIDKLQKKLSKRAMEELVAKTVAFKEEKVSQSEFYAYLVNKAKALNADLNGFPELQKYIVYISTYDAVDKAKVMDEMAALERDVRAVFCENDDQKRLAGLSGDLAILKNIFNIALTRDDYRYYNDNKDAFAMRNYSGFISARAPRYKITATLDPDIEKLDRYREDMERFYELSFKRDRAFVKNIRFSSSRQIAIVITGGFHTENLCEMFKKEGVSYISIIPNFRIPEGYRCPYFSLLAGKESGLQAELRRILASGSSMQIASMLSGIAQEVWDKAGVDAFRARVVLQRMAVEKGWNIEKITPGPTGNELVLTLSGANPQTISLASIMPAAQPTNVGNKEYLDELEAKARAAATPAVTPVPVATVAPATRGDFAAEAMSTAAELDEMKQDIYLMWGELSDRIGYYASMHYIFNGGDRKTLFTAEDIGNYASKEIKKLEIDADRLTRYWEKQGIAKALSTLRSIQGRAEQIMRITTEKPAGAPGAAQSLLANIFTGKYSWLNWVVRIFALPATVAHELGHYLWARLAGQKDVTLDMIRGETAGIRGPPAVYGGIAGNLAVAALSAGVLAVFILTKSHMPFAIQVLTYLITINLKFALAEFIGAAFGRGDLAPVAPAAALRQAQGGVPGSMSASAAPSDTGALQEEEEAREFLKEKIDLQALERDFAEVIRIYGYRPFEELYDAADFNVRYLFQNGLPALKNLFTEEELKTYWPDLVRLGIAAGVDAGHLFQNGLPALKNLFTEEEFKTYWPDLVRLGIAAGLNARYLFKDGLPAVKNLFTEEEFKTYWPDLVRLGIAADFNARYLFKGGLPAVKNLFTEEEFKTYWPDLVRLGDAAGVNAGYLFENGLPAAKGLITDREALNLIGDDLVRLGNAADFNAGYLFKGGLPAVKNLFTEEEFKTYWPDLVRLGDAAGVDAGHLFKGGLPAVKNLFTEEEFKTYWPDLVRLGIAAGVSAGYLFKDGLPAVKGLITDRKALNLIGDDLVIRLQAICRAANEYNREELLNLLVENYLKLIKQKSLDIFRTLDFYAEVIQKEERLALQVLDGVAEGIRLGAVDLERDKEKIFSFVELTHSFSPVLFRLYKVSGANGLKDVMDFAGNVLRDKVGEAKFSGLKKRLKDRGIKGQNELDEALLVTIQMAIPSSGASFVKKDEIQGLFEKYRQAGDRRADIPRKLRGRDFGDGSTLEITSRALREGESRDPDGAIHNIVERLRYKDRDISKEQKLEAQEKDRKALHDALIGWFADMDDIQKKEAALGAFYAWASHNDVLGEKIDALGGDYSGLSPLEDLFADKGNLSVLLRSVLKDIPGASLPVMGAVGEKTIVKPEVLASQVIGIWKSKRTDEEKEEVLAGRLAGIALSEVETKLMPLIAEEGLRDRLASLAGGKERMSQDRIVKGLFSDPLARIRTEKSKYEIRKAGEAALEFRVVKGIPYGLWGLNAGVCTARDIKLWEDKRFFLLAIIDTNTRKVVGFVHLFETVIDGRKVLTVPGIEPSVEFLSEVKTQDLYPLIEKALQNVAEKGGYGAVYIPTKHDILSNRYDIIKIVIGRGYGTVNLAEPVNWNTLPTPFPFSKVYTLWKRGAPKPLPAPAAPQAEELARRRLSTPISPIHEGGPAAAQAVGIHAGFGIAMAGDAYAVDYTIEVRKESLKYQIARGKVPEGFTKETVTIAGKITQVVVNKNIMARLAAQRLTLQQFIDNCITIRGPDYRDQLLNNLKEKPLIIDSLNKSPNLYGNCRKDNYIYINQNAPVELDVIGVSHELMHEAGIFTDSANDEKALAKEDLKLIADSNISLSAIIDSLAGKIKINKASPLFAEAAATPEEFERIIKEGREAALKNKFDGSNGWVSEPKYLKWLNDVRGLIGNKAKQEGRIVYYYGIGGGLSIYASGAEKIDILSPLIATDFTKLVSIDISSSDFDLFKLKVAQNLAVIGLDKEDIEFEKIAADTFVARFNYEGKRREVKVIYGKDAKIEYPKELDSGYNVLYSRGMPEVFRNMDKKIKRMLFNNLIPNKGFMVLENSLMVPSQIDDFVKIDLGDTAWAGDVRRLEVFFNGPAIAQPSAVPAEKGALFDIGNARVDKSGQFTIVYIPADSGLPAIEVPKTKADTEMFLRSFEIAKNAMDGLAARSTLLRNVDIIVNGERVHCDVAIAQEQVTPLDGLLRSGTMDDRKALLDRVFELERAMYRRGIHNIDHAILKAYGIDRQGNLVIFDFLHLSDDLNKHYLIQHDDAFNMTLYNANQLKYIAGELADYFSNNEIGEYDLRYKLWGKDISARHELGGVEADLARAITKPVISLPAAAPQAAGISGVTAPALPTRTIEQLLYDMNNPKPDVRNPINDLLDRLELLHKRGILQGKVFYPAMGNDITPAFFADDVYSYNTVTGIDNAKDIERVRQLLLQKGLHKNEYTEKELDTKLHPKKASMLDTASLENLKQDLEQSGASAFDVLFLKGVSEWVAAGTTENQRQTEEFLRKFDRQLFKPGGYVIVVGEEDAEYAGMFIGLGYSDVLSRPEQALVRQALEKDNESYELQLMDTKCMVGRLPIRILQKPQAAKPATLPATKELVPTPSQAAGMGAESAEKPAISTATSAAYVESMEAKGMLPKEPLPTALAPLTDEQIRDIFSKEAAITVDDIVMVGNNGERRVIYNHGAELMIPANVTWDDVVSIVKKIAEKLRQKMPAKELKAKPAPRVSTVIEVVEGVVEVTTLDAYGRPIGKPIILTAGQEITIESGVPSAVAGIKYRTDYYEPGLYRTTVSVTEGMVYGFSYDKNGALGNIFIMTPKHAPMTFEGRVEAPATEAINREETVEVTGKEAGIGRPAIDTIKTMIRKAATGEEKDMIAGLFAELANIHKMAQAALDGYPGDVSKERNVLIPLAGRFCPMPIEISRGKYQSLWKEMRDVIGRRFSGVRVLFYDGTPEDLNKQLASVGNRAPINTIAYVDSNINKAVFEELAKSITVFKEELPKSKEGLPEVAYMAFGGHVALGIGVLDIVENRRTDDVSLDYVANLVQAISGGMTKADEIKETLKKGDFLNLVLKLPPIRKIDIQQDMKNNLAMQTALVRSL